MKKIWKMKKGKNGGRKWGENEKKKNEKNGRKWGKEMGKKWKKNRKMKKAKTGLLAKPAEDQT